MARYKIRWHQLFALGVFPAFLIALHLILLDLNGPFWISADPDYAYLMNSLTVLDLNVPGHRDHPGTTVQVLGALALKLHYPTKSHEQIVHAVIKDPERELRILSLFLVTLCSVLLFSAGSIVAKRLSSLEFGTLFQVFLFCSSATWDVFGRFTPDLLVMSLGALFAALTVLQPERRVGAAITYGAVLGTKLTGAPLAFLSAVFLFKVRQKGRNFLIFGLVALVSAMVFAFPLLFKWKESVAYIFGWLVTLASHSGNYGDGPAGLPSLRQWAFQSFQTAYLNPIILTAVISGLVLSRFKKTTFPKIVTYSCLGMLLIQLLVVGKHPGARYILPVFGVASLLNCLMLVEILKGNRFAFPAKIMRSSVLVFVLVFALFSPARTLIRKSDRDLREAELKVLREVTKDCTPVCYFWCSLPQYALYFGNNYVFKRYSKALESQFENPAAYDGTFLNFDGSFSTPQQLSRRPICLKAGSHVPAQEIYKKFPKAKLLVATKERGQIFLLNLKH